MLSAFQSIVPAQLNVKSQIMSHTVADPGIFNGGRRRTRRRGGWEWGGVPVGGVWGGGWAPS